MANFAFHVNAKASCPHGGQVSVVSTHARVKVSGQPVATLADQYLVTGCAFTVPVGKPQPCAKVVWQQPAKRVKVNGQPVILHASSGLCQSAEQIAQGGAMAIVTQTRVGGQ